MTIRAVLFDLGDTLVRLEPFPADLAHVFEEALPAGMGPARPDIASAVALLVASDVRNAHQAARREEVDIPGVVRSAFADLGLDCPDSLAATLADAHGRADVDRIHDVPGRAVFLDNLRRRGYRLGIVSNTTTRAELLSGMLGRFGLLPYFEAVVYSSREGVRKPHPGVYEAALSQLAIEPSAALFVGDRLREDVLGPRRLGMRGVLTHEFFQDAHAGEPDAVLSRLVELEQVLDDLSAHTSSA
ncbi:MAG: HAD family hydrolase [Dehalococcoidia bacterium]